MFSIPTIYHERLSRPAVDRFMADPTAFDLCFSACIFLTHFFDVYAEHHEISLDEARHRIEKVSPDFMTVRAVAIAAKHVVVANKSLGPFVGLMAQDATLGKAAAFSDGTYFSDGTSFSEMPDVVRIQTPDGRIRDLAHATSSLAKVIEAEFLDQHLPQL